MTISDETLMAFSDGELTHEERVAVERAIRENPELGKRVARHRALRDRIELAYSAELAQPVPERLLATARGASVAPSGGNVVHLTEARAAVQREGARQDSHTANRNSSYRLGWRSLGGMAAGILMGLGVGYGVWQPGSELVTRDVNGGWIARGSLRSALTAQLTKDQTAASPVHIGISFKDKAGEFCRSFALSGSAAPSGIACHRGADWQIQTLIEGRGSEAGGQYRAAGTQMPLLLLKSIEAQIEGEPLDQAGEAAARQQDWRPPAR